MLIIGTNHYIVSLFIKQLDINVPLEDIGTLSFFIGIEIILDVSGFHLT